MNTFNFHCAVCNTDKTHTNPEGFGGTGYAVRSDGGKICYDCCGRLDAESLENLAPGEKYVLYLSNNRIVNWPGSLKIPVTSQRKSWHNFAGKNGRTDIWFTFKGNRYHGVNVGDNQILRVRKLK